MKPPLFAYHRPSSVEETTELLAELGDEAKLLAGGQSLMPMLNLRLATPSHVIDISRLDELAWIRGRDGGLSIGATTRQREVERSSQVKQGFPLCVEALNQVGHVQIRNRGTFGGSLAHADPAAELPAVSEALGAEIVLRSHRGERVVPADEFFITHFTTALQADELLTEVRFPPWPRGAGWAFEEISRRQGDFAIVGVAALLPLENGRVQGARIVLTGCADRPLHATSAERLLEGKSPAEENFAAAAEAAAEELEPSSDLHATGEYRRIAARVLIKRTLTRANERTGTR